MNIGMKLNGISQLNHILYGCLLLMCIFILNACGQYGDLYLPEEEPAEEQTEKNQE